MCLYYLLLALQHTATHCYRPRGRRTRLTGCAADGGLRGRGARSGDPHARETGSQTAIETATEKETEIEARDGEHEETQRKAVSETDRQTDRGRWACIGI